MGFRQLLTQTCTIRRFTASGGTGNYGGPAGTWGDFAVDVPCLKQPLSGKSAVIELVEGREARITDFVLFLEVQDVTAADRIVHAGETYGIIVVKDPGGQVHHLELFLELVKP
jgi:hypothetical protein